MHAPTEYRPLSGANFLVANVLPGLYAVVIRTPNPADSMLAPKIKMKEMVTEPGPRYTFVELYDDKEQAGVYILNYSKENPLTRY